MTENSLFDQNTGLVYAVFNDCFSDYRWLEDDLIQEGMLALLKAGEVFVPDDKLASFSTFAYKCIKNTMLQIVKRETRMKCVSMSAHVAADEGSLTYEETYGEEDERDEVCLRETVLSCARCDRERFILEKRMSGCTQKEIAVMLHISEVRVSEILKSLYDIVKTKLK